MVRTIVNITIAIRYEIIYPPWNGVIANIVQPWSSHAFSRSRNLKELENGESWRKIFNYDIFREWYMPSNAVLRDLDQNFQDHTFEYLGNGPNYRKNASDFGKDWYWRHYECIAADAPGRHASTRTPPATEWVLLCFWILTFIFKVILLAILFGNIS